MRLAIVQFRGHVIDAFYTVDLLRPRHPPQRSSRPSTPARHHRERGRAWRRSEHRAGTGSRARAYPPGPDDRAARAREDRRLLERYHRDGDPAAREALVERFLPLARQLARRYQRGGEPLDDLDPGRVARPAEGDRPLRPDAARPRSPRSPCRRSSASSSATSATAAGRCASRATCRSSRCAWSRVARGAGARARPRADAGRDRRAHRRHDRAGARGARGRRRLPRGLARPPARRRRGRRRPRRRVRHRGPRLRRRRGRRHGRAADARARASASARSCACASREDLTQAEIGERVGVSQMHVSRIIRQADRAAARRGRGPSARWRDRHPGGYDRRHGALGPAHARRRAAPAEDPALRARRGAVDPDQPAGRRGSCRSTRSTSAPTSS